MRVVILNCLLTVYKRGDHHANTNERPVTEDFIYNRCRDDVGPRTSDTRITLTLAQQSLQPLAIPVRGDYAAAIAHRYRPLAM